MRRISWLLLLLAGCAGPDSDPVEVAERFHALQREGDDRGIHALLTESDRAAMPLEAFPGALPPGLAADLLGAPDTGLDSASLLSVDRDTAAVLMHGSGATPDTLTLVATRTPRSFLWLERERVSWRVSKRLAEWARIDSLATALRAHPEATGKAAVERANAYLRAAEPYPAMARPADMDAARSALRRASVVEALRVDLRVAESFMGTRRVSGQIENPTGRRVATLRLIVTDEAGKEERVELWDLGPRSTTPVSSLTGLRPGRLTHRLERVQVY